MAPSRLTNNPLTPSLTFSACRGAAGPKRLPGHGAGCQRASIHRRPLTEQKGERGSDGRSSAECRSAEPGSCWQLVQRTGSLPWHPVLPGTSQCSPLAELNMLPHPQLWLQVAGSPLPDHCLSIPPPVPPATTCQALSLAPTGTLVLRFPQQLGAATAVPPPRALLQLGRGMRVQGTGEDWGGAWGPHGGLTRWRRPCCSCSSSRNRLLHSSFSAPSSVQRKRTSASSASNLSSTASLASPHRCHSATALAPQLSSRQRPATPTPTSLRTRDNPPAVPGTHLPAQAPAQKWSPRPPPPPPPRSPGCHFPDSTATPC